MKIIVTIPAYNEAATLGQVIQDIHRVMKENNYDYMVSVVDDGSTDGTAQVAQQAGATVHSHPMNYGLAETFRTEIKQALKLGADVIIHTDADGQYLAKDIPKLVQGIKEGNDLVLGNRFAGHIESMPFMKRLGNKAFSRTISRILKKKVGDCQTGFRAFTREVAQRVKLISYFTYTQEQIIKAVKQKFKIKEVPVYFAKREDESRLMSNPIDFAIRAGVNLLRIYRDFEPLKFFLMIGSVFFFLGAIIGIFLLYTYFSTGVVGHLPLTILTMLLIIIGIQISIFGFLADMKRTRED